MTQTGQPHVIDAAQNEIKAEAGQSIMYIRGQPASLSLVVSFRPNNAREKDPTGRRWDEGEKYSRPEQSHHPKRKHPRSSPPEWQTVA